MAVRTVIFKVRASERNASLLAISLRAQPKLNNVVVNFQFAPPPHRAARGSTHAIASLEIQVEGGAKYGTTEIGEWLVDYIRKA